MGGKGRAVPEVCFPDYRVERSFREDLLARHRFLDPGKVFVVPNVPDLETMESYPVQDLSSVGSSLQNPVFFYFGVIAARRGIFRIFEVFKQYLAKGYQGSLLLIGPVDKSDRPRFQEFLDDPMIQPRLAYVPGSIYPSFLPIWLWQTFVWPLSPKTLSTNRASPIKYTNTCMEEKRCWFRIANRRKNW
ncbi:MAG: hypothetical protein IPH16_15865 [Haliscomenobacter sp.]|nr:hypothetical protein [Haliscomenobacter sp.]